MHDSCTNTASPYGDTPRPWGCYPLRSPSRCCLLPSMGLYRPPRDEIASSWLSPTVSSSQPIESPYDECRPCPGCQPISTHGCPPTGPRVGSCRTKGTNSGQPSLSCDEYARRRDRPHHCVPSPNKVAGRTVQPYHGNSAATLSRWWPITLRRAAPGNHHGVSSPTASVYGNCSTGAFNSTVNPQPHAVQPAAVHVAFGRG